MQNSQQTHVLLVEDNPDDQELTRIAFSESRIANRLEIVEDGQAALEYLGLDGVSDQSSRDRHPSLVLLDLKLPRVDGLEVLRTIRGNEATRSIPVVVLTTSNETSDLATAYGLGVNSYIRKPVDFGQFTEAVKQLGLYWLVLNEPPP